MSDVAAQTVLEAVTHWQVQRLRATYQDFLEHADYAKGTAFFIDELFLSAADSKESANLQKVLPMMAKLLPASAIDTIKSAEKLKGVTSEIHSRWASALNTSASDEDFVIAYSKSELSDVHAEQLKYLLAVADGLNTFVQSKKVQHLIHWAKGPATLLGVLDLHLFIEKGYAAFRAMPDTECLKQALLKREAFVHEALVKARPKNTWWGDVAASETHTALVAR